MEQVKKNKKKSPIHLPKPIPVEVPRFEVDDIEGYNYLEENGYCVFKNVANDEELEMGRSLAWDYLESLGVGIKRDDISTWNTPKWPDPGNGIVLSNGVGQSSFLWHSRSIPKVQTIFSKIWNAENVITSFDGFCIHRPFEYNINWKTTSHPWYHLDQNGHNKPNKLCIQGLLNYYKSGCNDGGLIVISQSHKIFTKIFNDKNYKKYKNDYVGLSKNRKLWEIDVPNNEMKAIKIIAEAGDFVVWDSRVIHCNGSADTDRELPEDGSILPPRRLVAYVCMVPQDRLTPDIHQKRIECYEKGLTTSHWPELAWSPPNRGNFINFKSPELTEAQKRLIPM